MMYNVRQHCEHCLVVQEEYKQVVYSFTQERGINKDFSKEKKIFFGVLGAAMVISLPILLIW